SRGERRPAVRDVRRRRPHRRPARARACSPSRSHRARAPRAHHRLALRRRGAVSAAALGVKLALARLVGALSRLRGGGTSAPGRLLIGLQRDAIATLGARLARGNVLISATNGKTTTARMAARIFAQDGTTLVHNEAGANMAGGVATALLRAARLRGASA